MRIKNILYAVAGIIICTGIFFYSCEKDQVVNDPPENPAIKAKTIDYLIKQGNHYCDQNQVELMTEPAIYATVTFDSSAIYTSRIAENQGDVNKLIGFSDCGTNHEENSARLGWSWNGKKFVVYAYAYSNKIRIIKTLGAVAVNQSFPCSVKAANNQYYFTVSNHTDSVERYCPAFTGYHYKLFPYFGGDEVAPHDVHIVVVEGQPAGQGDK